MSEWHELWVEGPEKAVRAFVAGFLTGRGAAGGAIFGADHALDPESLGERLKELFGTGAHHVVLVAEPLAGALAEVLAARGSEVGLRLERRRAIDSASFPFRVETFSRALAREIRAALLEALPPTVTVEALAESEETHPDAHGPEPFAPLHEYTYRASGRITGQLPDVLEIRRRARERDFVEVGALRLEGRMLPQ